MNSTSATMASAMMALSRSPRLTVEVKRDSLRAGAEDSAKLLCSVLR